MFESLPYAGVMDRSGVMYQTYFHRAELSYTDIQSHQQLLSDPFDAARLNELQYARLRAPCHLRPNFDAYVEMLNFLFELKDFRDIAREAHKAFRPGLMDLKKLRRKLANSKSTPDRDVAGSWLFLQFAAIPFISDMRDITHAASECAHKAYQQFLEDGVLGKYSHYGETIYEDYVTDNPYNSKTTYFMLNRRIGIRLDFNATMHLKYHEKIPLTSAEIVRRYWGLKMTPEVLWNMGKGTFLVDYFIKVGDSLSTVHRGQNLLSEALQYCESTNEIRTVDYITKPDIFYQIVLDGKCIPDPHVSQRVSRLGRTRYERIKTEPLTCMPIPKFNLPSGRQGLNMLALARVFF
jgi:hypothetical protein